ncbi:MAG: archaemetzincin family Zn-dependent metalloprotease [Prolixibacteraceae bacterium]
MNPERIKLISFGYFEKGLLEKVVMDIEHEFKLPVKTKEGHLDLSLYYDPSRRQYDGYRLLKEIDSGFAKEKDKTLGLFNVDLYIPILTYIFGQAYLNGKSGIASIYRLRNERYGIFKDEKKLVSRFRKEVIHELGHTFGLLHCYDPTCVMRSSTYVEDIDQKNHMLCHKCKGLISNNT